MREQHADKEWMALLPAVGSDLEDTKAGKALLQRWLASAPGLHARTCC